MRSIRREGGIWLTRRSHPLGRVHLHDVALDQVVPPFEQDAALEAFADFVHVVLEATQRADAAFPQLLAAALEARPVAAMDHTIGDDAAGDGASASLDRLANLGVAVDDLLVARLEHACEH